MARASRHTRGTAAVLGALALHALVVGGVAAFGATMGLWSTTSRATAAARVADPPLAPSCSGEVLLATSARAALCMAPWHADIQQCADDVSTQMWMDLSSCRLGPEPVAQIEVLKPRTAERLPQIDPEKLLAEFAAQEEQQPPKPPELQPAQPQPTPAPPPPPPPQQRPAQVVENVKPNEEVEPENAQYLAEFNTRTDKQTVSRGARNEPMVARAKPEELTATRAPKDEPALAKPADPSRARGTSEQAPDAPGPLAMRKAGAIRPDETPQPARSPGIASGATGPAGKDGYVPRKGVGAVEQQQRDPGTTARGQGGAGGGVPDLPALAKNKDILERVAGGGSVDRLENVDEGDETSLNAKAWVHASFFNRMKRQVAQSWRPEEVMRAATAAGKTIAANEYITEVRVSLDGKGALAKITVAAPSGSALLDDEAIRAFRSSAPYPNPPTALMGKDGLITFSFGFVYGVSTRRTSWRMNR